MAATPSTQGSHCELDAVGWRERHGTSQAVREEFFTSESASCLVQCRLFRARNNRHTFATHLLNAGVALEVLKELMGHRSIALTLRYTQLYDATKKHQYEQAMAQMAQRQTLRGR